MADSIAGAQYKAQHPDVMLACLNTFGPQPKSINWKLHPPEASEKPLCGTWTAVTDEYGLRASDIVMLADSGNTQGTGALIDAAKHGERGIQKCAWLEFYEDHSGFWNSCVVEDGKATELVSIDVETQKRHASGLRFHWYETGDTIHIQLEDCLKYSLPFKDTVASVHVKYWDIVIDKKTGRNNSTLYTVHDCFPEYDYASPKKIRYSFSTTSDEKKLDNYDRPATE